MPIPLIRYRTGDLAVIHKKQCACGKTTFSILGRVGFDTVKMGGLELKASNFEAAAATVEHLIDILGFQVHVHERAQENKVKPVLVFTVPCKSSFSLSQSSFIRDVLRNRTVVGPQLSIKDAEERGLLFPSEFNFAMAQEHDPEKKRKTLIIHRQPAKAS